MYLAMPLLMDLLVLLTVLSLAISVVTGSLNLTVFRLAAFWFDMFVIDLVDDMFVVSLVGCWISILINIRFFNFNFIDSTRHFMTTFSFPAVGSAGGAMAQSAGGGAPTDSAPSP